MKKSNVFSVVICAASIVVVSCATIKPSIGKEREVERSDRAEPEWKSQRSMVVGSIPSDTLWTTGYADRAAELDAGIEYASAMSLGQIAEYIQTNAVKTAKAAYNGNVRDVGGKFEEYAVASRSKVTGLTGIVSPHIFWQRMEVETAEGVEYYYKVSVHSALSGKEYRAYLRNALEGIRVSAQQARDQDAEKAAEKAMAEVAN